MTALAPDGFLRIGTADLEYRMIAPQPDDAPTIVMLHEGLGEGEIRPPIDPSELPAPLREAFERGQREGAIREDGDFELFYVTAICLLTMLPALPRRLGGLAGGSAEQARERLRDQAVDLLLDGLTGPAGRGR